jgi:5'-nucleotidase
MIKQYNMQKQILYIDLDGVVVDLEGNAVKRHGADAINHLGKLTSVDKHLFDTPEPVSGAIEAVTLLMKEYDVFFLSTAPWSNVNAWSAKRVWVQKHFGKLGHKRLILSHRKDLLMGDYLIDDRPNNGAAEFKGQWLQFGKEGFENWDKVLNYLIKSDI